MVLLGYSFWKSRFGGAENIIGQSLTLDGKPFTVIGVLLGLLVLPIAATAAEEMMENLVAPVRRVAAPNTPATQVATSSWASVVA